MESMKKRLSAIVTFHNEGLFAHTALLSYATARSRARSLGHEVEFVLIADRADELTRAVLESHATLDGSELHVHTSLGDVAAARNAGVAVASGEYICTLDGDDLISRDYFSKHLEMAASCEEHTILHPEMVVSFGKYNAFNWQVDQEGEYFDAQSLLSVNPWISAVFGHRKVFQEVPYVPCYPAKTGFGFEDWYWNCETISAGMVHRLAWGTAYFYRRKSTQSLNESNIGNRTLMPKSRLFDAVLQPRAESAR